MRALLAALTCHKGDIWRNVSEHLVALDAARHARCDVAIFPELSLTGSVDALRHAERAVTLHDDAVRTIVETTRNAGFTAIFGIAERAPTGELFITQLVARDGELAAFHRKRHLGEDEEGYGTGDESPIVDVAGSTVGLILCAESPIDDTWDATHRAGAEVVAMCSAPGLYGRRTSDDEWRAGLEWWESAGLADACRNAHRLDVWVAMATQAGSTDDEDFPGIAALVSPAGEVIARLPDWRPGTLVVDIPRPGETA
jgi:predicted amidohydrolase